MAIVLAPPARPLLRLRDGSVSGLNPDHELARAVADAGERIPHAAGATGRIELANHPAITWAGAGFLVAPRLILTARFVADLFVEVGSDGYQLDQRYEASVSFGEHLGEPLTYQVVECLLRHPVLEVAVLKLEDSPPCAPLLLDGAEDLERGAAVAVVSYFAFDSRNDPKMIEALGDFVEGEKVLSPGRVLGNGTYIVGRGRGALSITHDCTTTGGSAGAPLIDLSTGRVRGLHFAGRFRIENYAVPASEMALDIRLRDLGISFSDASPDPDPDAFEAEYRKRERLAEPTEDVSAAKTESTSPLGSAAIEQLTQSFKDRYPTLDEALASIAELGEDYAGTISSQPGRGRSETDTYLRAVLNALNRRGLLGAEFRHHFFAEEEPATQAERIATAAGAAPRLRLDDQTLEAFAEAMPKERDELWELATVGSPYAELFAGDDGTIPPLPDIVRSLGADDSAEAREALAWLVRHTTSIPFVN